VREIWLSADKGENGWGKGQLDMVLGKKKGRCCAGIRNGGEVKNQKEIDGQTQKHELWGRGSGVSAMN